MAEEKEVIFEKRGALGLVTLNRPKALNALTHGMCLEMTAQLNSWAKDDAIKTVAVRGAGERAFCAGGDIRALYDSGREGTSYARDFWHDEYLLDAIVKHFPKPYVALIRGIDMGGGVGVSVNGSHRVADETITFAMPETGIGLFPDVGGSYFLPRLPGELGMYIAMTGARLKCADAVASGVVTHFVPAAKTEDLIAKLAGGKTTDAAIRSVAADAGTPPLAEHRAKIDAIFSAESVEEILARLERDGSEWAAATAATMRTKSPTSLKIAFRQLREGRTLEFDACMRMEFRMVTRIISGHDFYEGVRATIIDKDGAPKWRPATLEEVSDDAVAAYFAPLGEKELKL